ncbi:hypothetical protein K2X30_01505 [bacterium]|jgi:hypothetical protein|nr:hypothetical protein [bacterium]
MSLQQGASTGVVLTDPSVALSARAGAMGLTISWSGISTLFVTFIPLDAMNQAKATFSESFFSQKEMSVTGPIFETAGVISCEVRSE